MELYLTARETGDRLSQKPCPQGESDPNRPADISLDPSSRYQAILGFGGAFTESSAHNFYRLSPSQQQAVLTAYFDPKQGNNYSLCRTHINSCDFSLGNYAHADQPDDVELKHFTIDRDREQIIPMIKAAAATAGRPLTLLASPWSPPAWMKTNGEMNHGGKLIPKYREVWARYYARYIQAYAQEGLAIWGLTVQNEPAATQVWDSCVYTAEEERDFVRDYLGPVLAAEGLGDCKVIIWDHNRDEMLARASVVLGDPDAARYIWGTGFHWYGESCFDHVQQLHDLFPDKQLLFTEGCQEGGPHIGSWDVGERYGESMINDLNRWTVGWLDWNLLLDTTGGPNHVGNLCSAPLLADHASDTVLFQSSYYYIGHFSRFIQPGAVRIGVQAAESIETTAFQNPDDSIVCVMMNRSDAAQKLNVQCGAQRTEVQLPARSIATLRIDPAGK